MKLLARRGPIRGKATASQHVKIIGRKVHSNANHGPRWQWHGVFLVYSVRWCVRFLPREDGRYCCVCRTRSSGGGWGPQARTQHVTQKGRDRPSLSCVSLFQSYSEVLLEEEKVETGTIAFPKSFFLHTAASLDLSVSETFREVMQRLRLAPRARGGAADALQKIRRCAALLPAVVDSSAACLPGPCLACLRACDPRPNERADVRR